MKKILLLIVILSLLSLGVACADSIRPVTLVDGDKGRSCLDAYTGALNTINYEHHEIHAGSGFFHTGSATLAANASTSYVIQTPDTTKWAHLTFAATGSAITTVDIYESVDLTGTGAKQTIYNSDRNSSATSGLEIWDAIAPGTVGGTLIWTRSSGGATQQSRVGMSAEHNAEIILKQNTRYMIRITSGTNDNLTNLHMVWYEHQNR